MISAKVELVHITKSFKRKSRLMVQTSILTKVQEPESIKLYSVILMTTPCTVINQAIEQVVVKASNLLHQVSTIRNSPRACPFLA